MTYPRDLAEAYQNPAAPFRNLDPTPTGATETIPGSGAWDEADLPPLTAEEVIERQRQKFGGMKIGSAFFGWLTAMGIVAILSVLLAATGAALGLGPVLNPGASSAGDVPLELDTLRWIVAGALLAIDLVAFYCGGYVAGRMARFSGVLQGLAVWLWAIVIALVVAGAGWGLSSVYDLPVDLPAFPRIPVPEDVLMIAGIIAAVVVALVSLGGAILGGIVGVRYHRRVDRAGLED